ncbi:MAG: fibronectin type III domain-containing protein [Bacillota bacterium]
MRRLIALSLLLSFFVMTMFHSIPIALAAPDGSYSENGGQKERVSRSFLIGGDDASTDRFIVKYKESVETAHFDNLLPGKVAWSKKLTGNHSDRYEAVALRGKVKAKDFVEALRDRANDIEYIQPDYRLSLMTDDPYFESQWGLENNSPDAAAGLTMSVEELLLRLPPHLRDLLEDNPELTELVMSNPPEALVDMIATGGVPGDVPPEALLDLVTDPALREMWDHAPAHPPYACDAAVVGAWEVSLGEGVVVAVIDTGIDITHEDLEDNMWVNAGEIPDNGIDEDGNGYVDDVHGWNFVENSNQVFDSANPTPEEHGTHIAGIIAAEKDNGIGIAGIAPRAKVMPLKVFGAGGTAHTSDIIEAIDYATAMGARVVNCSWGSTSYNPALEDAIAGAPAHLFVCAAGNSGMDIDQNPVYPASFVLQNIISVASVNRSGFLSAFSNYGLESVDVTAPGEDIVSTAPVGSHETKSGTSMAAGFVSGEAALLLAADSSMTSMTLKGRILTYCDRLSSLESVVSSGGKINCANAAYETPSDGLILIGGEGPDGPAAVPSGGSGFTLFSGPPVTVLDVTGVASGNNHNLALRGDGTVWAWGYNDDGQLGDGTTIQRTSPVQVSGLTGVIAIAAGDEHSLALKGDGTLWAWGRNNGGQLGDGTTTTRKTPVQVKGLTGITALSAGIYHTLALKGDGTVWAWGDNNYYQLGDPRISRATRPIQVSGLTGVTAISAGDCHSLAVKGDGTVWAWGRNHRGQLGVGSMTTGMTPVQVPGLTGFTAVAAADDHSLALRGDGTVWAWGYNDCGQLGDGTTTLRTTPVQVHGLTGVTDVVASWRHNLAIKGDGTVWAWGHNRDGKLGDGTMTDRITPVQVIGLAGVSVVAAGSDHSLALRGDGTVWVWGNNAKGQLGDGTTTQWTSPIRVPELTGVSAVAAGYCHNLVLKEDGTVRAWGRNEHGELGDGTTTTRKTPVHVPGLTGVIAIAAGDGHSLALKGDGTVGAWGANGYGQLGDGTTTQRTSPIQVPGLTGVATVAAGAAHSLVVKGNGTAWAWGRNDYGQVGDGTTTTKKTPVQVPGMTGVTAVSAGHWHNLVLKGDGTVWAWGRNTYGQLGNGTVTEWATPVQVSGLTGVTAMAAGQDHSLALREDGTVWAWGGNYSGQLGDGTTTNRASPVQVSGLTGVTAIAAGLCHSLAVKEDGTVWAWGWNYYYQLGDGTMTQRIRPVQVPGLTEVTAVAAGNYHGLALGRNGTLWAWGSDSDGQLGGGAYVLSSPLPMGIYGTPPWVSAVSLETEIDLTYGIIGGTLYYEVEIDGQTIDNGKNTAYADTGLSPNSTRLYRVRSVNETGYGEWTDMTTVKTLLRPPTEVAATVTATTMTIWWNSVDGATNYDLKVGGTTYNTTATTYTLDDLTPGTAHTFSVKARGDNTESGWSVVGTKFTLAHPPSAPEGLAAVPDLTAISLTWESVSGATGYDVEVDGVIRNVGNHTTYEDAGLEPSSDHTYRVRARSSSGKSGWSVPITVSTSSLPAGVPGNLRATPSLDSVTVQWDAVESAVGYELEIDGETPTAVGETTYLHEGLEPGSTHTYSVRSVSGSEPSDWSPVVTVRTRTNLYPVPENLGANAEPTSVTLSWDECSGVTGYEVEADGEVVGGIMETSYDDEGLLPETAHTYRVRTVNEGGVRGDWSKSLTVSTLSGAPQPPTGIIAAADVDKVVLSWDSYPEADGYEVKVDDGDPVQVTDTVFVHGGLPAESEHTYRVLTLVGGEASSWSDPVAATTLSAKPGMPTDLTAVPGSDSIGLIWKVAMRATSYDVRINGGEPVRVSGNAYIHAGLTPEMSHTYEVRGVYLDIPGDWSSPVTASTLPYPPETPGNIETSVTADSVTVSWDTVDGAAGYDVYLDGEMAYRGNDTEYTATGLLAGSRHAVSVRARNEGGVSAWSTTQLVVTDQPGAPGNFKATVTLDAITLNWNAVPEAVGYDLEIDGVVTNLLDVLTYAHQGLSSGTAYEYRVRARTETGTGDWSGLLTVGTMLEGTTVSASGQTTSVTLTWTEVENAASYDIEADGVVVAQGVTGATYTHDNVVPNTEHTYRVKARNSVSEGEWSPPVTVQTSMPSVTLGCVLGEVVDFVISVTSVGSVTERIFTVVYDPAKLEVLDLCATTPRTDMDIGTIKGTDITVTRFDVGAQGQVIFTVGTPTPEGRTLDGALVTIRFRAKATGPASVLYDMQ